MFTEWPVAELELPMILTPDQIATYARMGGWRDTVEVSPGVSEVACAVAIAMRESAGNPAAFNGNAETGDQSYGLLQINLKDPNVKALMDEHGYGPTQLVDPLGNMKAGFLLYGGRVSNLNLAWYIARPGSVYQQRYQQYLPIAQLAALSSKPQSTEV